MSFLDNPHRLSISLQPRFFQSFEPAFRHPNPGFVSDKSSPRPPRRGGSFESETGFVSDKSGLRPPRRGGSFESETGFVSDKSGAAFLGSGGRELEVLRNSGAPFLPGSARVTLEGDGPAIPPLQRFERWVKTLPTLMQLTRALNGCHDGVQRQCPAVEPHGLNAVVPKEG